MWKPVLGVILSTAFAIALTVTTLPEQWRTLIVVTAWSVCILAAALWSILYWRERRASRPRFGMPEYSELLRELVDRKQQKASDENSGGYELKKKPTSLNAKIEQVKFYDRSDAQKPYLILSVLLLVENTGAPTAAKGWRLTFKSAGLNTVDFKAAGRQTDRDLGRGIILYKNDSLIEKLELSPLPPGTPARGCVDYYFENKKLSDLQGKPFEMEIAFRDTFGREGTANFAGVVQDTGGPASYFPGVEREHD